MPEFMIYPFICGMLVAAISGPLGCFVSWTRMAFFGHTLSHSALIGVALAAYFNYDITYGVLAVSLTFAVLLSGFYGEKVISRDTWMAITAHGSLAVSLVILSLYPSANRYLNAYLFGDILATDLIDLHWLLGAILVTVIGLFYLWNPMLKIAVSEEIAQAEGVNIKLIRTLFMMLVAVFVAISLKIIGGLMLTALLIIPAAAARRFTSSPEHMAVGAVIVGLVSVFVGLFGSVILDTPPTATIVVASLGLFALLRLFVRRLWS